MKTTLLFVVILFLLTGCSTGKFSLYAYKKYSPLQLQKDYSLYRDILEEHHPGLYWYTPKDSMDYFFDWGKEHLEDSLTEPEFRKLLNYVTSKIDCGHTSVRPSKAWTRYVDTMALTKIFPLSVKVWPDTMVVTGNLNRKDSLLTRGVVITKINGRPTTAIVDSLFKFISTDGYNLTHKYQSLSNRGFFGSLYNAVFGLSEKYSIDYVDSARQIKNIMVPAYNPARDTLNRGRFRPAVTIPKPSKKERRKQQLNNVRLLKIDTVNKTAMMDLSSFGRGYGLRHFFRRSFRMLQKNEIGDLIIDVRGNGGGSVTNSSLITKYLADRPFKVADTLFAISKNSAHSRYIQNHFWNKLFITFFTRRRSDGFYHFGYFERHYFTPKKRKHYGGQVYILTGGNSFSATTLFASSLIKQKNVTIVGEETGGGAYGNSAWLIPDVTLPVTGVRFRLPLFRLVIDKTTPKNGRGVQPEVEAGPTVEAIRRGADYKVEKALELIKKDKMSGPVPGSPVMGKPSIHRPG